MKKQHSLFLSSATAALMGGLLLLSQTSFAGEDQNIKEGKELALKHCPQCHNFKGAEQAGTVAPPFLAMKARFPDRKKLYDIIYDPAVAIKPSTMMPPFGRHEFMTPQQINKLIDFLYTL